MLRPFFWVCRSYRRGGPQSWIYSSALPSFFSFPPLKLVRVVLCLPIVRQCTRDTIKTPDVQGKRKTVKNTIKMRVPEIAVQNHQYPCGFFCGWVKRAAQILPPALGRSGRCCYAFSKRP